MMEAIQSSVDLIQELFLDGFLALLAVSIAAPFLGVLLVLRQMPVLGLAVPQVAGCGQAAMLFFFGLFTVADSAHPSEPNAILQVLGALMAVLIGILALVWLARDQKFLGVHACILFLIAIALRELFFLGSPYHKIAEESIQHGRLLTVDAAGRNQVLITCAVVVLLATIFWRRLWIPAFDPAQAQLLGLRPRRSLLATLLLLGATCALCVPVIGPEVVLTLMLVPAAILRSATPSLAAYPVLSIVAGLLGSAAAFVLACTEGVDWPPGPAVVVCVIASSGIFALALAAVRGRSR